MKRRCVMIRMRTPSSESFRRYLRAPRNHRRVFKQPPLRYGKPVQASVLIWGHDSPLVKAVGNLQWQFVNGTLEPLRCDLAHLAIEVGADTVEVHIEDRSFQGV